MSNSLWPHESQHARPPCSSQAPRVYSDSCPSSWWCHPAISSPSSSSPPAPNPSQHHSLFQRVNSSHEVAKVLKFQLQHQSFQWTPRTWSLSMYLLTVWLNHLLGLGHGVRSPCQGSALKRYSRAEVAVLVTQSSRTLCNPMDCTPPGSSVHGIF